MPSQLTMTTDNMDVKKKRRLLKAAAPCGAQASTNMSTYEVKFTACDFFNKPDMSDLKLNINDSSLEFYVHRIILSSRSEYFKKMFTGDGWRESKCSTVDLTVEEEYEPVFENFLKFMYGFPIDICKENMWLYYYLADEYLVEDLTRACAAYSRENLQVTKRRLASRSDTGASAMDASTCFTPAEVADIFNTFTVDVVKTYAASNLFARFDAIDIDLWLTFGKELVCAILNSGICLVSEQDLFVKAIAWLRHDENRADDAEDVLSAIRFSQMPSGLDLFTAQMDPFIVSSPTLTALVAAGCHYKYMKKELSQDDFAKVPEFKKKQYFQRRYRRADGNIHSTPT